MQFAFPGILWFGAVAGAVAIAIHLLSWRRPEPRRLPTARFIPEIPQRALSRRLELSDAVLLALRLLVIAALAFAVAGPKWVVKRSGIARIVIFDRSRSTHSIDEVRDSVRAAGAGAALTRLIAFDSAAVLLEGTEFVDSVRVEVRGNLDGALVLASHEAASLRTHFDSVDVVIVSPIRSEELSNATAPIIGVSGLNPRVMPVNARAAVAPSAAAGAVPPASDPVGAAFRLSSGDAPAGLRVVRSEPVTADSAHAERGGVLVVWPENGGDSLVADGILSASGGLVLRVARGPEPSGEAIAWWRDGGVAATEEAIGAGCIRQVAVKVGSRGDATLRPAFQRFVQDLSRPCGWADTVAANLPVPITGRGVGGAVSEATALADASSLVQRLLLLLALLGLAAEWSLRRRSVQVRVPVEAEPAR